MKTKKNKKYYNFTEKHKRKDGSIKRKSFKGAPKWFVRILNKKFESECRMILKNNIINGTDKPFPVNKKDAGWLWW